MTTYNTIANSDIDPESPITTNLMTFLRDNPIATAEGASGAPKIENAAFTYPPGRRLLETVSFTTATNDIDFILTPYLAAGFKDFVIKFRSVLPTVDILDMLIRFSSDGGSTFITSSSYQYALRELTVAGTITTVSSVSASSIILGNNLGTSPNEGIGGEVSFQDLSDTDVRPSCLIKSFMRNSLAENLVTRGGGLYNVQTAVDAIRIFTPSGSGSMQSGAFTLYGELE